jgi:hypothetical protein
MLVDMKKQLMKYKRLKCFIILGERTEPKEKTLETVAAYAQRSIDERWQEVWQRRFWSVLRQENGEALGTLITCYFHDQTQLRIPQAPKVLALAATDSVAIEQAVVRDW